MAANRRIESKACPICGEVKVFYVPMEAYIKRTVHGALIQDAYPMLDANDRERMITGLCPTHWDELFFTPEEEYDEDNV